MRAGVDALAGAYQARVATLNHSMEHAHILLVLILVILGVLEVNLLAKSHHHMFTLVLRRQFVSCSAVALHSAPTQRE